MKKKLSIWTILLVASIVILYSCGNSGDEQAVSDTTPPELTVKKAYVVTNDINNIDLAEMVTYNDEADCIGTLSRFTKLADLKVMTDAEVKAYADALVFELPQNLMAREDASVNGEGVYSAVYVVTDASGNTNASELIVVLDTTPPEITGADDMDESVTVKSYDDIVTNNLVEQLTITDNLDGVITKSMIATEVVEKDAANHVYTVTAEYTDRAGNTAEVSYDVTAVLEETEPTVTEEPETSTEDNKTSESEDNKTSEDDSTSEEPTVVEYTYTELNKTMYAKSSVNVRDLPTSDGNKRGKLTEGQEVEVTGRCNETGWYRIKFGSFDCYVSDKYLTDEKPETKEDNAQYSYEDRDGDGFADLAEWTEMGGYLVYTKDNTPEFAKFKKELFEAGMYVVKEYHGDYYVVGETEEKAFEFLHQWMTEHGYFVLNSGTVTCVKDSEVCAVRAYNFVEWEF